MHYQRDGAMSTGYGGSSPNYYPNSDQDILKEAPEYREPGLPLENAMADRYNSREGHDVYTQIGNLWRIFPEDEKSRTGQASANAMQGVRQDIQMCQLCQFKHHLTTATNWLVQFNL